MIGMVELRDGLYHSVLAMFGSPCTLVISIAKIKFL